MAEKKTFSLSDSLNDLKQLLKDEKDLREEDLEGTSEPVLSVSTGYQLEAAVENVHMARKSLESDPDNPALKDWLAFNLYASNRYEESLKIYEELVEAGEAGSEQFYYMGNCCFKLGRWKEAVAYWRRVVELEPHGKRGMKARQRIDRLRRKLEG